MSDLIYRLRHPAMSWTQDGGSQLDKEETISDMAEAADELERLRAVIGWIDAWTSNEVGSYSIYALDGLFKMTREKIAALSDASGIRKSES